MIIERGVSTAGEAFIDIEARSAAGVVEARLKKGVLEITFMEGRDVIFQLAQIQQVFGQEAFRIIKGYATNQLAGKILNAGYLSRFTDLLNARMRGSWTGSIVKEAQKTWLVFTEGLP